MNKLNFKKLEKTEIQIAYKQVTKKVALGKSKFGGNPHLPKDFEWYWFEGESRGDKVIANRPLSFLAQINLAEVSKYDKEHLLPLKGILYFFYEWETSTWGFDPKDRGSARVYYYPNNKDLIETNPPTVMNEEYSFPEFSLSFKRKIGLPDSEEFHTHHRLNESDSNLDTCNIYDDEREKYGYKIEEDYSISKLLGYANLIQAAMLEQCEIVTNGFFHGSRKYSDNSFENLTEEQAKTFFQNSSEWILLFQMGTIEDKKNPGNFSLIFGDCGNIYFYIKKHDLANRNFENTWFVLQC